MAEMYELPIERLRELTEAAKIGTYLTPGAQAIVLERARQIAEEGWTYDHDDRWKRLELLMAAACYAEVATVQLSGAEGESLYFSDIPEGWPWGEDWWKPSGDPVRNLEKSGALIAATIDQVLRSREADGVEGDEGGRFVS